MEAARNGAVQQASSRGEADRFVLSSAVDSSSNRDHGNVPHPRPISLSFDLRSAGQVGFGSIDLEKGTKEVRRLNRVELDQAGRGGAGKKCSRKGADIGYHESVPPSHA